MNTERNDKVIENKNKDITFSFKYLSEDDEFHIRHPEGSYFQKVIERMRDLCGMSYLGLIQNNSRALRFHRIDWASDNVSRDGFDIPGNEDLFEEAYQFSVSSNEHGRIMGFFTDNRTFNIVWFDRNHDLYE